MAIIESRDFTLEELFGYFYVVRAYQREYVWEEKHVNELLNDVYIQFEENKSGSDWEYFIGSIIVCESKGVYELIDGQQRMTTICLILCAIRDFLQTLEPNKSLDALKKLISSSSTDRNGNEKFRDRIELQYDEDSRKVLENIASKQNFDNIPENGSVERIKNAYNAARIFFREEFGEDKDTIPELRKFYACFIKNVKLVRVETKSMSQALTVFATINNRGVGLDGMDLLKNLMFIQIKNKDFDKLKVKWQKMLDIIFKSKEKPLRFLRYFIMANYDSERLRKDNIYEWFEQNKDQCGYLEKPFDFMNSLLESAQALANFKKGQDINGNPNRYLQNILYLSSSQHLVLLLATKKWSSQLFTEICQQVENFLFIYNITGQGTNKLETVFRKWAAKLRVIEDKSSLHKFIAEEIEPKKKLLASKFENSFYELQESSINSKKLKYILAKLTQYIDEEAYKDDKSHVSLQDTYMNKSVEIEHILPQKYNKLASTFDKPDDIDKYVERLGNLTLIEKPINSSIKNKSFEIKKESYKQSKYLITKSIAEKVNIGINTSIDRAVKGLDSYEEWNSESIESRQKMLTQLAKKVWDIDY